MKDIDNYDVLDYQLADLLVELNHDKNKQLYQTILDSSKHAREGCIALSCEPEQADALIKTKVVGETNALKPLIIDNGFIYLRRYWAYQQRLAEQINQRLHNNIEQLDMPWAKNRLQHYFAQDHADNEVNWQQIAAALALSARFLIISGGPGTGKTTTITRILALLIEQNNQQDNTKKLRFSLAAPTGKAAMRMSEAIRDSVQREQDKLSDNVIEQLPKEASTIHRLLGYIPHSTEFRFNKNNLLATDIVVIDEASMIDLALMTKLFEAIPPQAKVILLGDKDQLSSVETGSVFTDLCATADNSYSAEIQAYLHALTDDKIDNNSRESSAINNHIICLQKSWRFNESSGIGQLASAINKGETANSLSILASDKFSDVELILPSKFTYNHLLSSWDHYLQTVKPLRANNDIANHLDDLFINFNHFRILTALRKGMNGCSYLNTQLEKQLLQQNKLNTRQRWYHGRPIMISENSYRTGLFNGDIGITLIDEKGQAKVWFQSKEGAKAYSPVRLPQHETAWASTIHKSQGSEFDKVLMILPTEDTAVLSQQLIYTGVTRAKQQLVLVSNEIVLKLGIERKTPQATQIQNALKNR